MLRSVKYLMKGYFGRNLLTSRHYDNTAIVSSNRFVIKLNKYCKQIGAHHSDLEVCIVGRMQSARNMEIPGVTQSIYGSTWCGIFGSGALCLCDWNFGSVHYQLIE